MPDDSMGDETSESLLARYVAGSWSKGRTHEAEQAFTTLYDRHSKGLRGFVYVKLKGWRPYFVRGGEEICQDAWIAIAKSAKTFQGRSKFFTWACSVAEKKFLDHVRKKLDKRSIQAPYDEEGGQPLLDDAPDRRPSVPTQVERNELSKEVEAALMELEEHVATVFLLRSKHGLGWREISELTGTPMSTLQDHHLQAVKQLKFLLQKHDPEKTRSET